MLSGTRIVAGALGALVVLGAASSALAVDRHERIQVSSIVHGGRAGAKIKLTLRPESYDRVRVGLGRMTAPPPTAGVPRDNQLRKMAAGEEPGYLRVRLGEYTGLVRQQPKEIEHVVIYGDGNDLQAGEKVDVVSAFTANGIYWHVFGMHDGPVTKNDTTSVIELPHP
jgi:hypothetical protein